MQGGNQGESYPKKRRTVSKIKKDKIPVQLYIESAPVIVKDTKKQTKIMFINLSTPTPNNTATIANSSSSSSFVTFFENVQASSSITGDSTNDFDQSNIAEAFLNKRQHLPKTNCAAVNQFFQYISGTDYDTVKISRTFSIDSYMLNVLCPF